MPPKLPFLSRLVRGKSSVHKVPFPLQAARREQEYEFHPESAMQMVLPTTSGSRDPERRISQLKVSQPRSWNQDVSPDVSRPRATCCFCVAHSGCLRIKLSTFPFFPIPSAPPITFSSWTPYFYPENQYRSQNFFKCLRCALFLYVLFHQILSNLLRVLLPFLQCK